MVVLRLNALLAVLLVAATLAPLAQAHGIEPTPVDPFSVILQDREDDCGPEKPVADCHGSDALIGLAAKEAWDGSQDTMTFRFYMDVGATGTKTDTLTFDSPAGAKTLSISSTDDQSFTQTGFDSVGNKQSSNDGTRFYVDATVARAKVGLSVADALSNVKVTAKNGNNVGDVMPGDCTNTVGACNAAAMNERNLGYTVRGSGYYAKLEGLPTSATEVAEGTDSPFIQFTLTNRLTFDQTVHITVTGASGVSPMFHDPNTNQYKASFDSSLAQQATTAIHLMLHGDQAGSQGDLVLTLNTEQGGHAIYTLPYKVTAGSGATTGTDTSMGGMGSTDGSHSSSGKKGAPSAAAPLVAVLLLGLALRRRS